MLRTNGEIKKDIVDQLYWDSRVDAAEVNVDVQNGEVTLFGTVPTFFARQAAEQDAWAVGGVSEVENTINVAYRGPVPEREHLEEHIVNTLEWDPQIDAGNIMVSVDGGEVTLEGTVDAFWKKLRLHDMVQDMSGVTRLIDSVSVVPTEEVVDETVAGEVTEALRRNDHVNIDTIDVTVENGHVTLTGSVQTWVARNAAYESAVLTYGVVDVDVNLAISS